jgi:RimJ/RimL family protein N-acetyltransferase
MRHEIRIEGSRYALRPVALDDAAFILNLRTDPELSAFLHPTSPQLADQEAWLRAYFERAGDWYFVVEDMRTGQPVGTAGIYDLENGRAEWGRWLLCRRNPAAVESALLIYRAAFERLGLEELYCRTVAANAAVVSFHNSSGAEFMGVLPGHFVLNGAPQDAVEHCVRRATWPPMQARLEKLAQRLAMH